MSISHLKELNAESDQESKDMVNAQEERIIELEKIADLMALPGAEPLRNMLKRDVEFYIRKMVADDDASQIANIRAYFRLMDKLDTKDLRDSIYKWVEEKIKELEK